MSEPVTIAEVQYRVLRHDSLRVAARAAEQGQLLAALTIVRNQLEIDRLRIITGKAP